MNTVNLNYNEILSKLSPEERLAALEILAEMSNGKSDRYNDLIYEDYEEVPVDIYTFLTNERYLGKGLINEEGRFTVFPYWVKTLKDIFPDPLKPANYNTAVFTGGIGLGKSLVAVLCGLYELYRMLCLRDPYLHYGLQPIDKITFAFMNITLDASRGVAWDKCQQLLLASPWFMDHGTLTGSVHQNWNPPKGIELIAGSLSRHIIGRAVYWCLDGLTEIATNLGVRKLSELAGKQFQVYNIDDTGEIKLSDICTVAPTAVSTEEYLIELIDGTLLKCTPTHRFMLTDGSYKEARYLTEDDDIINFLPYGYIYKVTNKLNGLIYIGKRVSSKFLPNYFGSGKLIKRAINKYGLEHFAVEVLDWAVDNNLLCALEKLYISSYNSTDRDIGYNISLGGDGGNVIPNCKKITNGVEEKNLPPDCELPDGWWYGSKMCGVKHPSDKYKLSWTAERRKEHATNIAGEHNPNYGNTKMCGENNSHAIYNYYYDELKFTTKNALCDYLLSLNIQIPKVTITNICEGKYTNIVKTKYPLVVGHIRRELKK